jgi:3-keto-disaccharide hydrolase
MKRLTYTLAAFITLASLSCSTKPEANTDNEEATATTQEITQDEWIWLFNGQSTNGWRGFNNDSLPEGWLIEDGTLKSLGTGGDIVYGDREFEDFELYLEWKISTAGNSGIFYHVQEGEKYHAAYQNAPEYQLIDDLGYPDPLQEWQKLAADYAMYPATASKPVKPAGEWNSSSIIFTKNRVQHFLNGEKVVEFVPWSEDWHKRRKNGKWAEVEDYGKAKKGLIGLQDHPGFVWFRNIKIKEL